jgi:phosphoglycolate phosphatase-like HAD superfamily hydrolase
MSTVLLFDIDGTLVSSSGVGRMAIERAFELRHGRSDVLPASFAGMTDKAITRDALLALGLRFDTEADLAREVDDTLAAYLRILEQELKGAHGVRIHAGIERALDMAERRTDVALGLGTGNVMEGARLKLECVGLFHRFAFGGFGDDAIDRAEIILAGAKRGAAKLNQPLDRCRVVVVGDTPRDITAAQAIGADSIAVATGVHTPDELRAHRPTLTCETLADPGVDDVLLG